LTLVDPDNRRPVDFDAAQRSLDQLQELRASNGAELMDRLFRDSPQLAKLHVTSTLLNLRRSDPDLFSRGRYEPLPVSGERQEHLHAFSRSLEDRLVIVVVPRWQFTLTNGEQVLPRGAIWGDTRISAEMGRQDESFTELLSGTSVTARTDDTGIYIAAADALAQFPLAVLLRSGADTERSPGTDR
jgi:(1->4)-alpha-D-glucan 1-alpha-D-glucosylmutase